jgi:hypothetical protein
MKKFITYFVLISYLACGQTREADAFVPALVLPAAIGAAVLGIGAFTLYKPKTIPLNWNGHAQMTAAANFARIAIGAQTVVSDYGQETLQGNYAAFKVSLASLQNQFYSGGLQAQQAMRNLYPQMAAFIGGTPSISPINSQTHTPGLYVNDSGQVINILSTGTVGCVWVGSSVTPVGSLWSSATPITMGNVTGGPGSCPSGRMDQQNLFEATWVSGSPPVPIPYTPDKVAESVLPMAGALPQAVVDDLDKMIAANANGYGISIVDAVKPADVDRALPLVIPAPQSGIVPIDIATPWVTGLGHATTGNAQGRLGTATAERDMYRAAHPDSTVANDPQLAEKERAVESAKTGLAGAEGAEEQAFPNAAPQELKKIDFSPFLAIGGAFAAAWPFSLLEKTRTLIEPLVSSPTAPVFDLPLPLSKTVHIDLAIFDPVALTLRWVIGLTLTIGAILGMVRFWRGVS